MGRPLWFVARCNLVFHQVAGPKGQNPARMNWYFFARLRVPADAGRLITDRKCAEGRDFNRFASNQRIGHFLQNTLDQLGAFIARQAYLRVDCVSQVHARQRFIGHVVPQDFKNLTVAAN